MKDSRLVFHPIFVFSLVVLLLNDFYLKQQFGNVITGKLSDFTGLIVFPIFFAVLFPISKKWISLVTAVLFLVWKTPVATPFIDFFNGFSFFKIQRVVDYSDYIALIVLPLAHKIINNESEEKASHNFILHLSKYSLMAASFFAICATSKNYHICQYQIPGGTVHIGKEYTIRQNKEKVIELIRSLGHDVREIEDSIGYRYCILHYYQTDSIVVYNDNNKAIDTIINVKYNLKEINDRKTKIEIINVTLSQSDNIQKWQVLKSLSKKYNKILKQHIIEEIK